MNNFKNLLSAQKKKQNIMEVLMDIMYFLETIVIKTNTLIKIINRIKLYNYVLHIF